MRKSNAYTCLANSNYMQMTGTVEIVVPPNEGENKLSTLIERENTKEAGLTKPVLVKSLAD